MPVPSFHAARCPALVQVSANSSSSRSTPHHAFQSVLDLDSSRPAPVFHPPGHRTAPISVSTLQTSSDLDELSLEPTHTWSRPRSLLNPSLDLETMPLTIAPSIPLRSSEVLTASHASKNPTVPSTLAVPSRFASGSKPHQKRARQPSANPYLVKKWHFVLEQLGSASQLFEACAQSPFGYQHADRILDGIAPSTALQYLTAVCNFLRVCQDMQCSIVGLTDGGMADLILVISLSRSSDSSGISRASTIKALRWLRRHALVDSLQCVYSALVDSFIKIKHPRDKKEAAPFPLWVLVQWERRILQSSCSDIEVLILGTFLFMAFSGLRFADLQRINLRSLVWSKTDVRGLCWRSKTQTHGHPFGLISSGFLSKGPHNWLWRFLTALDATLTLHQPSDPDFLLPDCSNTEVNPAYIPMSYAKALSFLRVWIHAPWRSGESPLHALELNYTIHGLKATFLSWGPQLHDKVSDDQRLQQGHHQDPRQSLRLYGRDSVWGALTFQKQIVKEVQNGFRPQIAQHRGGQAPLKEPPVTLEYYRKDLPDFDAFDFSWFHFDRPASSSTPAPVDTVVSSSESSSESDSSDSSASTSAPAQKKARVQPTSHSTPDECVMGRYRSVIHAMVIALDDFEWRPTYAGSRFRSACGRKMTGKETQFLSEWDTHSSLCQHPGCRKIWASLDTV